MDCDLTAERLAVEGYRQEWMIEKHRLDKLLRECHAEKNTPPHGYWEAEHRARAKYQAARDVLQALEKRP